MGGGSGRRNVDGRLEHGGQWRSESAWPLPDTRWTSLYLHRDRSLATASPAIAAEALHYAFDPHQPTPTLGGAISSGEPIMRAGAYDHTAIAERPDVLVFTTPPLDQDLEIVGPVTVRLWIASDAPDTDFTAKLLDVYPPSGDYAHGFAMNLTEGLLRVRYRDSWERPALMTPGEVYPIEIALFPIANRFCRGHRLRLDISSSNFPHFDVNPNLSGRMLGAPAHRSKPGLRRGRSVVYRAAGDAAGLAAPSAAMLASHLSAFDRDRLRTAGRASMCAMLHDPGSSDIDTSPSSHEAIVNRYGRNRVVLAHGPRPSELRSIRSKHSVIVAGTAFIASIVAASSAQRAPRAMRVRDVHGRAQIAVEFLHLGEREGVRQRREFCVGKTLRDEQKQAGRFGQCPAFGHERRNAALRVYSEVFGAPLGLRAEIEPHRLIRRTGFFERDVGRERTGPRSVIELQHRLDPGGSWHPSAVLVTSACRRRVQRYYAMSRECD